MNFVSFRSKCILTLFLNENTISREQRKDEPMTMFRMIVHNLSIHNVHDRYFYYAFFSTSHCILT